MYKILSRENTEVRYNSEWLGKLTGHDMIRLCAHYRLARMLEREDFRSRLAGNLPIAIHELLYPLLQAYDSVAIEAEVELGAIDQLFNLLLGRHYQREFGQPPQICAMTPLLVGLDGVMKMSKSLGNYVGISEPPETQFGKLMSMPDELIPTYARYAAFWSKGDADTLAADLAAGSINPMTAKKCLAEEIVARYHGQAAARVALEYFERTVQRKEIPTDGLPELELSTLSMPVSAVMVQAGLAESKRAAERLISGNGVKVDGIVVSDPKAAWSATEPAVLSVGARKFIRIVPNRRT